MQRQNRHYRKNGRILKQMMQELQKEYIRTQHLPGREEVGEEPTLLVTQIQQWHLPEL
jgi:hypothetical protein